MEPPTQREVEEKMRREYFAEFTSEVAPAQSLVGTNSPDDYDRVPWWRQGSAYSEKQRKERRSIFVFVVLANVLLHSVTGFDGVQYPGLLADFKPIALPALPFTILLPSLSLLLVFRTNTAYFRWNEARTLW